MAKPPLILKLTPKLSFVIQDGSASHCMEVECRQGNVYKLIDPWTKEVAMVRVVDNPGTGPLARAHEEVFNSIMRGDTTYEVEVLSATPTMIIGARAKEPLCQLPLS